MIKWKWKSLIPDKSADDDLFVPKPTSKPAAKKPAAPKPPAAKRAKKGEPCLGLYHVPYMGIMYHALRTGIM